MNGINKRDDKLQGRSHQDRRGVEKEGRNRRERCDQQGQRAEVRRRAAVAMWRDCGEDLD